MPKYQIIAETHPAPFEPTVVMTEQEGASPEDAIMLWLYSQPHAFGIRRASVYPAGVDASSARALVAWVDDLSEEERVTQGYEVNAHKRPGHFYKPDRDGVSDAT